MDVFLTSYGAAFTSVVLWYPYRDMVKAGYPYRPTPDHFLTRWKGMLSHPYQPALLAVPSMHPPCTWGYVAGMRSGIGVLIGGTLHAAQRSALATLAGRMSTTDHKGQYTS